MPTESKRELPEHWQQLLAQAGCKNLTDYAKLIGVSRAALGRYAFEGLMPKEWKILLSIAKAGGMSTDAFLAAAVGEAKKPSDERIAS